MTFQPPPPPPQGPPPAPGPPPGQWGPPPGLPGRPGGSFDPKTVDRLDWGILGAGFLAFVFSFVSYYTVSVRGFGSGSENAWHGFFGWFAMLLALIGSGAVALELFAPQVKLPFPSRLVGLVSYAVATLSVIIALFVFPESVPDGVGVDTGRGAGYWLSLIVIIAGLVLSVLRFQQTGGKLPIGAGMGRPGGGHAAPPPGYGPPPGYQQPPQQAPPAGYQPPSYQPPPTYQAPPSYQAPPTYQAPPQEGPPPGYQPPPPAFPPPK